MKTYTQSSLMDLEERLSQLDREIEAATPELSAERRFVASLIAKAKARQSDKPSFAKAKGMIEAIQTCLEYTGEWMTRQQIGDMLVAGDYPLEPATAKGLLRQALRYHSELAPQKNLKKVGEQYGLTDWLHPAK